MRFDLLLFVWALSGDFDDSYLLAWQGQHEHMRVARNRAESLRVRAGLQQVQHLKVSKVKHEHFGLKHDYAAIRLEPYSLDFALAVRLNNALHDGCVSYKGTVVPDHELVARVAGGLPTPHDGQDIGAVDHLHDSDAGAELPRE